jgi:hypothetical protein
MYGVSPKPKRGICNKAVYLQWLNGLSVGSLVGVVNTKYLPICIAEVEKIDKKWVYVERLRYSKEFGTIEGARRGDLSIRIIPPGDDLEEKIRIFKNVKYLLGFTNWGYVKLKDLDTIIEIIKENMREFDKNRKE